VFCSLQRAYILNLDLDTLHHDLLVGGFNPSEKY